METVDHPDVPSLVTIVMPTKDRANVLAKAIGGILSQTYQNVEVVVVDDGSTDHTESVVRALSDARVRYVRQSHKGRAAARNRGIREASGGLVGFLDDDDEVTPDWISSLAAPFYEDPECGIASCGTIWVRPDGRQERRLPRVVSVFPEFRARFLSGTFLVRSSLLEAAGGYAEDLPLGQNNELGWRLLKQARLQGLHVHPIDRPLVMSERRRNASEARTLEERTIIARYMLTHHADVLEQSPVKRAAYLRTLGKLGPRDGVGESDELARETELVQREGTRWWAGAVGSYIRLGAGRAWRVRRRR
jgi:glycosyltransferase involved in cell wall biosynthesis